MSTTSRLARALDPRRSIRARLLLGFLAALLIPTSFLVFLLSRDLADVQNPAFRRELLLVLVSLAAVALAAVWIVTRRFAAPIEELVRAAEEIGQGRPVELARPRPAVQDELGRLAVALDRAG